LRQKLDIHNWHRRYERALQLLKQNNRISESMIVTEALKRMTQTAWSPEVLPVVEEASRFDCRGIGSLGRHCGIQALLLSQYPMPDEVMSNVRVVPGPISSRLIERYDPLAASAILDLRENKFLWEECKGTWHKFRLEDPHERSESPEASTDNTGAQTVETDPP
jgi:hypothetical protein